MSRRVITWAGLISITLSLSLCLLPRGYSWPSIPIAKCQDPPGKEESDRIERDISGLQCNLSLCIYIPAMMLSVKPASRTKTRSPSQPLYWNSEITMWLPGKCRVWSRPDCVPPASFLTRNVVHVCGGVCWGESPRLSRRHLELAAFVRVRGLRWTVVGSVCLNFWSDTVLSQECERGL